MDDGVKPREIMEVALPSGISRILFFPVNSIPTPHRVLFVCMGNICRSPAAEIIFRKTAGDAGRGDEFIIDSAGTIGYHQGNPPDPRIADSLRRRGYEIVSAGARKIRKSDLETFT